MLAPKWSNPLVFTPKHWIINLSHHTQLKGNVFESLEGVSRPGDVSFRCKLLQLLLSLGLGHSSFFSSHQLPTTYPATAHSPGLCSLYPPLTSLAVILSSGKSLCAQTSDSGVHFQALSHLIQGRFRGKKGNGPGLN